MKYGHNRVPGATARVRPPVRGRYIGMRTVRLEGVNYNVDRYAAEVAAREPWVLTRLRYGHAADSAIIEGPELRALLHSAGIQRRPIVDGRAQ